MVAELKRRIASMFTAQPRVNDIVDEINRFGKLPQGWNSYRAPQISKDAIAAAIAVVQLAARRGAPLPSPAPTPQGVALCWDIHELEIQMLVDDESLEYSVARRGHPKVAEHGSLTFEDVEKKFLERYLIP